MRSRRLNKRIEIWQTAKTGDTFEDLGMLTPTKLTESWCEIKTLNKVVNSNSIGINNPTNMVVFKLRHRNDIKYNSINQFIMYRGEKYIISNQPFNVDFRDKTIEIIATKEVLKSVNELTPLENGHQNGHQHQYGQ